MTNPLIAPKAFPTELTAAQIEADRASNRGLPAGYHESLMRAYHVLNLVKDLLEKKVAPEVILQIISLNYPE